MLPWSPSPFVPSRQGRCPQSPSTSPLMIKNELFMILKQSSINAKYLPPISVFPPRLSPNLQSPEQSMSYISSSPSHLWSEKNGQKRKYAKNWAETKCFTSALSFVSSLPSSAASASFVIVASREFTWNTNLQIFTLTKSYIRKYAIYKDEQREQRGPNSE